MTNLHPQRIETCQFYTNDANVLGKHKPLLIGCSGGSGHNVAIEAIIRYLIKNNFVEKDSLALTQPNKQSINTGETTVKIGAVATNLPLIKPILDALSIPNLPSLSALKEEAEKIKKEQEKKGLRPYVDVLLDVFPAGAYYAAICNVLHRQEKTDDLKKLINYQKDADGQNYDVAKMYFLNKLNEAFLQRCPYTEVISTQALALPALCDAVKEYNKERKPPIKIHQYMSDLPTVGAVHFFNSLAKLTPEQGQLMYLYGVNLEKNRESLDEKFKLSNLNFAKLLSIDPQKNPMIRQGFSNSSLDKIDFSKDLALTIKTANKHEDKIMIKAGEKVASIMLGSLAGEDTIDYTLELCKQKNLYNHIFVFGGRSTHLKGKLEEKMKEVREKNPDFPQVILLDPQDDIHVAPIMTRSNVVVIRGGGLTSMEQMAMPHLNPEQVILFHSKRNALNQFTSGVSWEDENADHVKDYLNARYHLKKIARTQPTEIIHELMLRKAPTALPPKNLSESDVFSTLMDHINLYRDSASANAFVNALDALYTKLQADYTKQVTQGCSLDILANSASFKIAHRTIALVQDLQKLDLSSAANTNNKATAIDIIQHWEKDCKHIPRFQQFAKLIAVLAATAIGFVLGDTLDWVFGKIVGGISMAAASSYLLFKPALFNTDVNLIENTGKALYQPRREAAR